MVKTTYGRLLLVGSVLLVPVLGCRGRGSDELQPVRGTVIWADGQPAADLAGGVVALQNIDEGSPQKSIHGEIQGDGSFVLRTAGLGEGVLPGDYRAAVMPLRQVTPGAGKRPTIMAPRFENFGRSGLQVTVEPETDEITIKVERAFQR